MKSELTPEGDPVDMHIEGWIVALTLAVVIGAAPASAQDRREIDHAEEPAGITPDLVAELSFAGMDLAPAALSRVFRWPDGGWGVSSNAFPGHIARFDNEGAPIGIVGNPGEGPGELGGEVFGVPVGEEIWIVDPANMRLHAFSSEFELTADRPLPGRVFSVTPAEGGSSVLVTGFLNHENRTAVVARLSLDDAADTFGGEVENAPDPRAQIHMAAQAANGEIWTFAVSGGATNVLDGANFQTVERLRLPEEGIDWGSPETARDPSQPRPAQLAGVAADANGYVWVTIGVPDREWTPEVGPGAGAEQLWDTLILAIDADRRRVVARARLDALCLPVGASRVSCVDELDERIRVLEFTLP